jgi:hypothetical protein
LRLRKINPQSHLKPHPRCKMPGPYYLRSTDGSNSDDGSTWALAKADLHTASTGALAVASGGGDLIYVSQAHAQTTAAAITLTPQGTAANPTRILCGNDGAQPPTASATAATVSTTGASNITFGGAYSYWYGITFKAGSSSNAAEIAWSNSGPFAFRYEWCNFVLNNTSTSSLLRVGPLTGSITGDRYLLWKNCTVKFGSTSQSILLRNMKWRWLGGSVDAAGSAPSTLMTLTAGGMADIVFDGVDLSKITGSLVNVGVAACGRIMFANCKLGAGVAAITGTIQGPGLEVYLENSDSGDTNYRMENYKYEGSTKSETTKVKDAGATDGTTPFSWNMSSLAGATLFTPLISPNVPARWSDTTTGSVTASIEIALDSAGTALNDDEIWMELEYLGTSGVPQGVHINDRKTEILAAGSAQTTSSVTWNNMTTPTKQKLSITFNPVKKGYYTCKVCLAKASTTVYVNPQLIIS